MTSLPSSALWQPNRIINWLLTTGRMLPDLDALVQQLGKQLHDAGAPLWRLRLSMRTLHPLTTAISSIWELDSGLAETISSPHGLERSAAYVGSPMAYISQHRRPYRKSLINLLGQDDHGVLHELKERGATDYFGLPAEFSDGRALILVFVSNHADGFSDHDIEGFTRLAAVLAPIAEVISLRNISTAVAEAYLGKRTGRRVLEGQITRGDIDMIEAAILVSDIRDWTGINARLGSAEALRLANRYYEVIDQCITEQGGEILKLLGDGVLAIFAVEDSTQTTSVCHSALTAAQDAFYQVTQVKPPLEVGFGIGLHFGEVLYGNIGSDTRIDFTVMGQAVNTAARIEAQCKALKQPLLYSQDFGDLLGMPSQMVSTQILTGQTEPTNLLTPLL